MHRSVVVVGPPSGKRWIPFDLGFTSGSCSDDFGFSVGSFGDHFTGYDLWWQVVAKWVSLDDGNE